jgi:serine/threonine protein kinase
MYLLPCRGYMPPEYIEKRQISPKFDVYSLGVTIIQIITGPLGHSMCLDMPSEEFIELVRINTFPIS